MAAIDFPNSPSNGTQHTENGVTWEYNGTVWNVLSGGSNFSSSPTPPSSPKVGDMWFDTDNGRLYTYYDSFWVNPASLGLREDGISTAAATKLTHTNAAGSAATLARSDHDHAIQAVGAFYAYASAVQTLNAYTEHQITFGAEEFDVSGWYSTSTSRYTPQKAGYYALGTFINISAASSTGFHHVLLNKNGSTVRQLALYEQYGYPTYPRGSGSTIIYANGTTDYFQINVYNHSNTSETLNSENTTTSFWGYYLGSA